MNKKVFIILSTMLLIAGLTAYSCKDELNEELTGSIVGTIADKTTGEPVPTVNVTLEPGGKSAITGSDGNYLFPELEIESYTVSVSKQGYTSDSKVLDVEPGKATNGDFLIERIPAVVTVDRDTLDFGEGTDVNSLSFNVVNSGYEDLEWKIEYDCNWIREVRDTSGTLAYGKTQAIVVFINRELLAAGENITTLVVRSSNGSSDLTIKAVGAEREEVVLNTLEVEDITSSTATFYGEIINAGIPRYTSRGFVYSTSSNPTKATALETLTAPVTDDSVYSTRVTGLELGQQYYVRAFAESDLGIYYSSNEVPFTATSSAPVVSVQQVSNIDVTGLSVVFNGTIESAGDPPFSEKGFVYGTTHNPTIYSTKIQVIGNNAGIYSTKVSDLILNQEYYVRAYAISGDGSTVAYSAEEVDFTISIIPPEVTISAVTDIDTVNNRAMFNGNVLSVGDPAYTEKGFIYGTVSSPAICDGKVPVDGSGLGTYSALVDSLQHDVNYYIWAYAENTRGITYSEDYVNLFLTSHPELPQVTTEEATNIDMSSGSATFNGTIITEGMPPYTERGFVYSTTNTEPTINNIKIIVPGNGTGSFSIHIENQLPQNNHIYIRAYALNNYEVVYGGTVAVLAPFIELPQLGIAMQTSDIGKGYRSIVKDMCSNSRVGGYNDWRLPTLSELATIYTIKNDYYVGVFQDDKEYSYYWSSDISQASGYGVMDFYDGKQGYVRSVTALGRCVRTLN